MMVMEFKLLALGFFAPESSVGYKNINNRPMDMKTENVYERMKDENINAHHQESGCMEKTESWSLVRMAYASLAGIMIVLGIVGLFLPLLPTTPFILIAAWAASKGSPRLHHWLWSHPQIGPLLHNWHTKGAVPRTAKWFACITMSLSWIGMLAVGMSWIILGVMALLFICVTTFLITRPES